MATHLICQSTEPLPHNYPSGPGRSHGAVSQYEVYNNSSKLHTRFPPPGWDFSQSSEEDSLPLLHSAPQPELKNSSFLFDPDLCVTPQKAERNSSSYTAFNSYEADIFKKPEVNPDPDLTLTPMKAQDESLKITGRSENINDKSKKQKVRFDLEETVTDQNWHENLPKKLSPEKPYRPELYDQEDDVCEFDINDEGNKTSGEKPDNTRTVRYTVSNLNGQSVYVPMVDVSNKQVQREDEGSKAGNVINTLPEVVTCDRKSTQSIPKTKSVGQKVVKVVREIPDTKKQASVKQGSVNKPADPIATCRVPENTGTKRKVKILRENQYTPKETEYTYPFQENAIDEYAGGEEHMFARPEYNSTLRMKLEAERIRESSVDLETALQKKLRMSDSTKTDINEKAANMVNTGGPAFSGLVSLNVPAEEMCKQAAEMKTARAKQIRLPKSKSKDHKEPDLMEFFSSDRQKESVTFLLAGISAPSEQLSTASHSGAFDLYKHNRVWEQTGKM